jgi:ribosomal protein S18 acetylase RimI-like enzyme
MIAIRHESVTSSTSQFEYRSSMTTLLPTGTATPPGHPLDHAAWASLTGPHAHFAEGTANVLRYPPDVSPFVAVPPLPSPQSWVDLAALAGPGAVVALSGGPDLLNSVPDGWELAMSGEGVQLVATSRLVSEPDPEAVVLGEPDVPEMLDLVARTQPGPFLPYTYRLGTYLGIRREGRLIAMAGERLHPPGWTEVSAVCTDAAWRGRGYASRLVRMLVTGIRARGETPLIHAAATNTPAIRLYESLGFRLRRHTRVLGLRVP